MASQNIHGIAVLNANDYHPKPGPLFSLTGAFSIVAAPFGGHAVNLAAITAALCAGPDAHPDPARRYWAAVVAGVTYILFGLLAGLLTAFISASPSHIIQAVAGLALLGALANSITGAVTAPGPREPAVITFLVTRSPASVSLALAARSGAWFSALPCMRWGPGGGATTVRAVAAQHVCSIAADRCFGLK